MNLYEGMFLLDNQVVRTDWRKAKALVTDLLVKHGGEVITARRWDERKLAYQIKGRQRGTYMLCYYKLGAEGIDGMRRDLELSETLLRYLLTRVEAVPEGEQALHDAELDTSFEIPAPPEDDEVDEPEAQAEADDDNDDEDDSEEDSDDDEEAVGAAAGKSVSKEEN